MEESQGYFYNYTVSPNLKEYKSGNFLALSNLYAGTYSSASNLSMRRSMLGMIGEGYERAAMQLFSRVHENVLHKYYCINMYSKELIDMDSISIPYLRIYFYDSCGLASYTNSPKCIENAFSEFVERQSFILSYLGKIIPKRINKTPEVLSIVPKKYHFVDIFDISIIDSFKVYFALGIKNDTVYCSLGAGFNEIQALNKLVRELNISNAKHGSIKAEPGQAKDYLHLFHMLSIEQILDAYEYMKAGEWVNIKNSPKTTIDKVVDELYRKYNMQPLLLSLFHPRYTQSNLGHAKNVKVFAVNWFPSLNVSSIPSEVFDNIEKCTNLKLNRKTNFIPFP